MLSNIGKLKHLAGRLVGTVRVAVACWKGFAESVNGIHPNAFLNVYTRTLKCFLSWCNEESYTKAKLKIYKAAETVKETYSDEELLTLLELFLDYIFQEDDSNE